MVPELGYELMLAGLLLCDHRTEVNCAKLVLGLPFYTKHSVA